MFFILIIYSFDIFVLTFSRDHVTPPTPTPLKNSAVLGKLCDPIFFIGGARAPCAPLWIPRLMFSTWYCFWSWSESCKKMVNNPQHVLHSMVPEIKNNNRYELRNNNKSYMVDLIIKSELQNAFIHRNFCHDKNANARTSHCMQKGGLEAG